MNGNEQATFSKLLAAYANTLRHDISADAIEIWWRKMERFDLEAIAKAFSKHTDQSKFFPSPAEILSLLEPHRERSPLMAWAEVERTISKHGAYETVQFERRYGEYQQHGVNYSTPLQGLVEQHNRLKGYHDHIPEPVLIGDGPAALPEPDRSGEVLSKLKQMVDQEEKPEGGEKAA